MRERLNALNQHQWKDWCAYSYYVNLNVSSILKLPADTIDMCFRYHMVIFCNVFSQLSVCAWGRERMLLNIPNQSLHKLNVVVASSSTLFANVNIYRESRLRLLAHHRHHLPLFFFYFLHDVIKFKIFS